VWNHQQSTGAILNYIDMNPSDTFEDASGTALLAACTFRLASLVFGTNNAPYVNVVAAAKARVWVISQVDGDGWTRMIGINGAPTVLKANHSCSCCKLRIATGFKTRRAIIRSKTRITQQATTSLFATFFFSSRSCQLSHTKIPLVVCQSVS
jgi:hypothetical protein